MKKLFVCSIILVLMLSACSKTDTPEKSVEDLLKYDISYSQNVTVQDVNPPTTDPEFQIAGYVVSEGNTLQFSELDYLWDSADYVVIGSPDIPYSEAEQHWLNRFNEVAEFEDVSLAHSYSVRPFKVNKVYKGEDLKIKEIKVCEHVLVKDSEMRVLPGSYPTQQGEKYILFLYRAGTEDEQYFPLLYQGKYSLNDSENTSQKYVDKEMLKQLKEKFKDEIK